MAEIKALETRPMAVQKDVVESLENALELAKKGELTAVAIAGIRSDGAAWRAWSINDCYPAMLGALEILKLRMFEVNK